MSLDRRDLLRWCAVPADELPGHPDLKVPFALVETPADLGLAMARSLTDLVKANNGAGKPTRAIVPCGPSVWYEPFCRIVNEEGISLGNLHVFHMDECLDWQNRPLPPGHPFNFRAVMEKVFYGPVAPALAVPEKQRHWLLPSTIERVRAELAEAPADVTLGGWGQDGHVAYNQARRRPYSPVTVEDVEQSTIRVQDNNDDTILALAHRVFGAAYQFVPPMSVTLGVKECLSAARVRVFSDTGAWKQTALRVALFGPLTPDYPMTLLQKHPDALVTATRETARHPISEHPEWELL